MSTREQTLYNVRRSVTALVWASSPGEAHASLTARLNDAGFDPYEADDFETFENEL